MSKNRATTNDLLKKQEDAWNKLHQSHLQKRRAKRKPRVLRSSVRKFFAEQLTINKKFIHAISKDE